MLFYGNEDQFETVTVSSKATAAEIINEKDVQVQLDIAGINNRYVQTYLHGKSGGPEQKGILRTAVSSLLALISAIYSGITWV